MSNLVVPRIVSAPPILLDTIIQMVVDHIWAAHDAGKSVVSLNALLDHLYHLPITCDEQGQLLMRHFYMARSEDAPAICLVHGECPSGELLPDVMARLTGIIEDVAEDGIFWYCCTQCGSKALEIQEGGDYAFVPGCGVTDSIRWQAECTACGNVMELAWFSLQCGASAALVSTGLLAEAADVATLAPFVVKFEIRFDKTGFDSKAELCENTALLNFAYDGEQIINVIP